jgi:hypothetical protein
MNLKTPAVVALTLTAACVMAGCGDVPGATGPAASRPVASAVPSPYSLYTHCGIADARIGGRWYQARPPLSDGSGNPPAGWANPYQRGSIAMIGAGQAVFTDPAGHHVRFVLRSGATTPAEVCS